MNKIKITAVSYMNTLPFLYGIKNYKSTGLYDFEQKIPSVCASQLITNKTDIALIPVAAIPFVETAHLVSNYCIGATGKVHTVLLVSDVPINEIKQVLLDYQSRTSVNLVKVLAHNHWHIKPEWINASVGFESNINGNTAGVVIGDRAFELHDKYKYVYDLSEEWEKMTSLPFVFAAWVANKKIKDDILDNLNKSLEFGLQNIDAAIKKYHDRINDKQINLKEYLTKYIDFKLSADKIKAMKLFYKYLIELNLIPANSIEKIRLP